MDIYKENGYTNRKEYLESLADDFGIDYDTVESVADLLGPDEDFDGLLSSLDDYGDYELG